MRGRNYRPLISKIHAETDRKEVRPCHRFQEYIIHMVKCQRYECLFDKDEI